MRTLLYRMSVINSPISAAEKKNLALQNFSTNIG